MNIFSEENWKQFNLCTKYKIKNDKCDDFNFINNLNVDDIYIRTTEDDKMHNLFKNVIDMKREHDFLMFNNLRLNKLIIPEYLYCLDNMNYYKYMNDDEWILKPFYGARSIGQIHVNSENIIEVLEDSALLTNDEFLEKYNIDTSTSINDKEKYCAQSQIKKNQFFLSKKVNFTHEYRILYFTGIKYSDYIIEERKGYQVNSKEKREHSVITENPYYLAKICKRIKYMGDNHTSPMLSFDIWVDETTGTFGCFEYCTEFGVIYSGYNKKLTQQMNTAIDIKINKFKK